MPTYQELAEMEAICSDFEVERRVRHISFEDYERFLAQASQSNRDALAVELFKIDLFYTWQDSPDERTPAPQEKRTTAKEANAADGVENTTVESFSTSMPETLTTTRS